MAGGFELREKCFAITKESCSEEDNFNCDHTEADTRIIFHVKKIQERLITKKELQIIIDSPDTDIFILLVAHYQFLENEPGVWFHTGKATQKRYIPVHKLAQKLGDDFSYALLAAHALTGCDTNSSFFGIGKKTVYSALKKLPKEDLIGFGGLQNLSEKKSITVAAKFVSQLYDIIVQEK